LPVGGRAPGALLALRRQLSAQHAGGFTCTHLREILLPLASAAFQSMTPYGDPDAVDSQGRSTLIDSCHAYGASRKIVLRRWPDFHRPNTEA